MAQNPWLCELGRRIGAADGLILEVTAGPSGGNLPAILAGHPGAKVLVNDLSRLVLEEWQAILWAEGEGEQVVLAAFDACRIPLRDASVAVVSDNGGINNISGYDAALRELARVLRPDGRLFSVSASIPAKDWLPLPEAFRQRWEALVPATTEGLACWLERYGWRVLQREMLRTRPLTPEESGLAQEAAALGVCLRMTEELVEAMPPG